MEGLIKIDGYDDCIIGEGVSYIFDGHHLVYDLEKIISKMMKRDGMSESEAYEFYEYNILGTWMGENMPIFLDREGYK